MGTPSLPSKQAVSGRFACSELHLDGGKVSLPNGETYVIIPVSAPSRLRENGSVRGGGGPFFARGWVRVSWKGNGSMEERNLALKLMYNGTAYHGWQVQKNAVSVAETLEKALATVVCHPVKCTGAGRTDAGVHAEVYVANFRTTSSIPCDRIPLAVNTRLPRDIVVVKATQVPMSFNAIGSCLRKEYTYRIYNSRLGNPFYVDRAWFYPRHLDEGIMQRAADQFVGTHDFRAVRSVGTETRTTVRTVYYFDVSRRGELIECRVCADGFLYNMVRAMTGTIVYAAEGKLAPEDIPAILASGNRTLAGPTVPPGGLYMTKLWYEEDVL